MKAYLRPLAYVVAFAPVLPVLLALAQALAIDAFHCGREGCLFWVAALIFIFSTAALYAAFCAIALLVFRKRMIVRMRRAFQVGLFVSAALACSMLAVWKWDRF